MASSSLVGWFGIVPPSPPANHPVNECYVT